MIKRTTILLVSLTLLTSLSVAQASDLTGIGQIQPADVLGITGDVDMNGNSITGLGEPTETDDAARLTDVESAETEATQDLSEVLSQGTDAGEQPITNLEFAGDPGVADNRRVVAARDIDNNYLHLEGGLMQGNIDMGGDNDLQGVRRLSGDTHDMRFDTSNDYIELTDSGGTRDDLVLGDIYIDDSVGWLATSDIGTVSSGSHMTGGGNFGLGGSTTLNVDAGSVLGSANDLDSSGNLDTDTVEFSNNLRIPTSAP